jgi:AraC-like DNA-binding protein
MNSFYRKVPASIEEYVSGILVIDNYTVEGSFALPLFANGSPTLVFTTKKALLQAQPAGHFTMFGQTISPGALTFHEDFTLIAYFFKPHALISLFNVAGNELSNTNTDLNLLKHADSKQLQEMLLNCASVNQMLAILNNYILNLVRNKKRDFAAIAIATNLLKEQPATGSLKKVQDSLYITEKTLQRMFDKYVGISPRLYRRICQFHKAFQVVNFRNFDKLSDVAYANDYADQSHFIRTFKEFTHLTPNEYLNLGKRPDD